MTLRDTRLALVDGSTKWGLVVVVDVDGVVRREYRISAAAAEAVRVNNQPPPGILPAVWRSGQAYVATRPLFRGQCLIRQDGWLVVNYGLDDTSIVDRVRADVMAIPPAQWGRRGEVVQVDETLAPVVDVTP